MAPKTKRPDFTIEGDDFGCGLDEVGRGPLAGPVVSACVYVPPGVRAHPLWREVTDSKKLSPYKRDMLFELLIERVHYGVGQCCVEEIDAINILQASLLSMRRAYEAMMERFAPDVRMAAVDGNQNPGLPLPCTLVVGGDLKSCSIAAASIIAKVTRDRIMAALHEAHPHYGWQTNAGYGTPEHLAALRAHGVTDHHRRSFAPVADLIRSVAA